MMRVNSRMRALLCDPAFEADDSGLPPDARATAEAGWRLGPSGALLLAAMSPKDAPDVPASGIGRHEYEVNDVYLSLDDLRGDESTFLAKAASRSLSFAVDMLKRGLSLPGSETLQASVSIFVDTTDEVFPLQGGVVRFFTRRGDHPDWFGDLEAFTLEAIAVLDATDIDVFRNQSIGER